jgi:hypothetical protein
MTDQWKELRAKNIGGSEVSALFDECPYLSHYTLWHRKRGNLSEANLDDIERIQAGNFYESGIMAHANWKWDFDFFQPKVYVEHWAVEGMGCTPDAYSQNDPDLMAQIKRVAFHRFTLANGWQAEGDTITKAPLHILLQVQHEMEVCKKKRSILIVQVGGENLYVMFCDYDPQIASILRKKVAGFWLSSLPPEPNFKKDGPAIREIKSKLPLVDFQDYSDDEELYQLLLDAKILEVSIKNLQDDFEAKKAEITYYSGNAKGIKCKDISASFYDSKGGNRFRINMEKIPL